MRVFGVACLALGVFGLLLLALHVAWQEFKSLRYVSRLDEWSEDIPEWH